MSLLGIPDGVYFNSWHSIYETQNFGHVLKSLIIVVQELKTRNYKIEYYKYLT